MDGAVLIIFIVFLNVLALKVLVMVKTRKVFGDMSEENKERRKKSW